LGALTIVATVLLFLLMGRPIRAAVPDLETPPALLTNAQQVLNLGIENARRATNSAALRGVVTFAVPGLNGVFVQDATAGILVLYYDTDFRPEPGQLVAVDGQIGAGLLSPIIRHATLRIVDKAPLPEPRPMSASRLAAGQLFGQWVEVEGAVRDVARDPQRLLVFISSGGIRFHAVMQSAPGAALPVDWLDAQVRLRGVCWNDVDRENKPAGFTLYMTGTNQMITVRKGSSDIFAAPPLTAAARNDLHRQSDRRVKLSGTVVFHSDDSLLFLQDESGSFQARLLAPLARAHPEGLYVERPLVSRLRPGTRIELVGASLETVFAPALQDVEFRVVGETAPPAPLPISARDALSGHYDRALVSLKARLLAHDRRQLGGRVDEVLVLQSGDTLFEAVWETSGTNALTAFPNNALIQAVGLCLNQPGELNRARSFSLRVRAPDELVSLGVALPWASWHVERILGVGLCLGAAALASIWLLRQRVAQRTAQLAQTNQQLQQEVVERQRAQGELHHALAAERELGELKSRFVSMVSHEFRTPLGIIMSSTEILRSYLDRLSPEKRSEHLNDIFESTRRMGDLMEEILLLGRVEAGRVQFKPDQLDLPGLCRRLIDEVNSATQQRCPIAFAEKARIGQARGDETLLRHILTNLLSNAVKYSATGATIEFSVEQKTDEAELVVRDQGIGIPEADRKQIFQAFHRARNVGETPGTGLGLVIVKRCVELHGGHIYFESTEGKGSTFIVRLPLFEREALPGH